MNDYFTCFIIISEYWNVFIKLFAVWVSEVESRLLYADFLFQLRVNLYFGYVIVSNQTVKLSVSLLRNLEAYLHNDQI